MEQDLRAQRVLATTMGRMARLSGGRVNGDDGLMLFDGAAPGVGLWAGVVRTDPSVAPPTVLPRAQAFFAANPRPFTVMTSSRFDEDLEYYLAAAGHEPVVDGPEMAVVDRVTPPTGTVELPLKVVDDPAGREAFIGVAGRAFAQLGEDPATWEVVFPDVVSLAGDDRIAMVGSTDGHPAVCGVAYLDDDVAHVIHVGTDPELQGRGFGSRLTAALTNEAVDRGAALVTLIATPPGEPVYRRLGYAETGRGRWWIVEPHAAG